MPKRPKKRAKNVVSLKKGIPNGYLARVREQTKARIIECEALMGTDLSSRQVQLTLEKRWGMSARGVRHYQHKVRLIWEAQSAMDGDTVKRRDHMREYLVQLAKRAESAGEYGAVARIAGQVIALDGLNDADVKLTTERIKRMTAQMSDDELEAMKETLLEAAVAEQKARKKKRRR